MNIHRDASSIILDCNRLIFVNNYIYIRTVTSHCFINTIIKYFKNHMMKTRAIICITYVHAGSLAATLRGEMPEQRIISHCGGGKPASQLKRAFSLGARYAILLDSEGLDQGVVRLRELKDGGEEATLTLDEAPVQIAQRLLRA